MRPTVSDATVLVPLRGQYDGLDGDAVADYPWRSEQQAAGWQLVEYRFGSIIDVFDLGAVNFTDGRVLQTWAAVYAESSHWCCGCERWSGVEQYVLTKGINI